MPQFQIDIQKNLGTEYWTNVYHLEAASLADALSQGFELVDREKIIHHTNVSFSRMRASAMPVSAGNFIVTGLAGQGLAPGPSDVPLFVVARVEFTGTFGRPGVKMYRGALTEGDVVDTTQLSPAVQAFFSSWVAATVAAVPTLQKVDGTVFVGGYLNPAVGMRQLRRGSKRRLQPVI